MFESSARFSRSAVKDISRSLFDRSNTLVTSFSAGKLVPIYVDEVLPGDTVTMDLSFVCRMATPLYPVMDNAWIDVHWFFVPNRLVWDHWKNFCGESDDPWDSDVSYSIPVDYYCPMQFNLPGYFGLPVNFSNNTTWCAANALPRRGYQLIWNEWYRDQNLQDPILIDKGDTGRGTKGLPQEPTSDQHKILPVNKYHDYFTSCLPGPQKGSSVMLPFDFASTVPVNTGTTHTTNGIGLSSSQGIAGAPVFVGTDSKTLWSHATNNGYLPTYKVVPDNLWADLSSISVGTINQLRQAFAIQRLLETDARGGSRYRELVKAHFGVDIGDSRVQVPEYLGGCHVPINIMQVVQQSSTSGEPSPLGETGAMSKTVHQGSMFTKSFVEHGYLFGLVSVRTQHSYMQGIPRMFNRRSRYDFYWPELANIGEQAVLAKEIYAVVDDDAVFGYQEAWADYRYKPNQITGHMGFMHSLNTEDSLSPWHYADFYKSRPYLSAEWMQETDENVARTLAVSSTSEFDQFIFNGYFKARWARPMPLYSIPGLAGHF